MCESAFICRGDDAPSTLSARPEPEAVCARAPDSPLTGQCLGLRRRRGDMAELVGAPDDAARCV
jgi:hypothetical protein